MDALIELCDLVAQNPTQFGEKRTWICSRCPTFDSLISGSPKVIRSHLNAVLAVPRFLFKCPNFNDSRAKLVVVEFLRSLPASFSPHFWPISFGIDSVSLFYVDFLGYVAKATELCQDFAIEVAGFMGEVLMNAVVDGGDDLVISRAFLTALLKTFLPVLPTDGDKLVSCLLDHYVLPNVPITANDLVLASETSSCHSSPANIYSQLNEVSNPVNEVRYISGNGGAVAYAGENNGGIVKQQVASFEEVCVESLEKLEIGYKIIGHSLAMLGVEPRLLDQVRLIAKRQLQSMSAFFKIRKRDWTEKGPHLKAQINTKLNVYQAAAWMQVRSLTSMDSDGKSSKRLLLETLALLIDAAEACLYSVWRKLKSCKELFASLLNGISLIAVTRGGQLLRILLIRLKPLVLSTCTQAGTWGSSQGSMLESLTKTTCEIIDLGWTKDRAPIDTFILGLATIV